VEGGTGQGLAHALIKRQNGTDRIALGEISPRRAAVYKNAEVLDAFILNSKYNLNSSNMV